ncbi:MAG: hypothetical protein ACK47B_13285 [Armatimonadota bacterium]
MKRRQALVSIWLLAAAALPVYAADRTVAVMPTVIVNASKGNVAPITEAIRANLEKHGYDVIETRRVDRAVRAAGIDLSKPVPSDKLARVRDELGVDFFVYPRLLNTGKSLSSDDLQANIIVNVLGKTGKAFVHTRQVGQLLGGRQGQDPRSIVLTRREADQAVTKLFEPFHQKQRSTSR